jgi:hypothetical protein
VILFFLRFTYRLAIPVFHTAINIESRYGEGETDWLMSTFAAFTNSAEYVTKLKAVNAIEEPEERIEELSRLPVPRLGSGKHMGRAFLILVLLGHIVGPIILAVFFFNWRLSTVIILLT